MGSSVGQTRKNPHRRSGLSLLSGIDFGIVQAIIATIAITLIGLGMCYRRAADAAARLNVLSYKFGERNPTKNKLLRDQHRIFMPDRSAKPLDGRPNPAHLRLLGLVTWEADHIASIEAAYETRCKSIQNRRAGLGSNATINPEAHAEVRRVAEARHSLLKRLNQQPTHQEEPKCRKPGPSEFR